MCVGSVGGLWHNVTSLRGRGGRVAWPGHSPVLSQGPDRMDTCGRSQPGKLLFPLAGFRRAVEATQPHTPCKSAHGRFPGQRQGPGGDVTFVGGRRRALPLPCWFSLDLVLGSSPCSPTDRQTDRQTGVFLKGELAGAVTRIPSLVGFWEHSPRSTWEPGMTRYLGVRNHLRTGRSAVQPPTLSVESS